MKRSPLLMILSFLTVIFMLFGCAPGASKIDLLSEHSGGIVPINDEVIAGYLSLPSEEALTYLRSNSYKSTSVPHDGQNVILSWDGGEAPYRISISENADLSGAEVWTTSLKNLQTGIFYPDTVYYWQVTDASGNRSDIGSFVTGEGVRLITSRKTLKADGVQNVRDEGGWEALDGKTVRYGLLYRGGLFEFSGSAYIHNVITEYGLDALTRLGIRTEIDLRNDTDCGGQTASPLAGCAYVRYPFTGYTSIYPKTTYTESQFEDPKSTESFREIFSLLSDETNYPVYFHCLIGQDRTGTLAYLVLGLLGVEYEDLVRDYELTAFSRVGSMNRESSFDFSGDTVVKQEQAFTKMHHIMMTCYSTESGRLSDAIANYLMSECDISQKQIDSIRSILLTD